MSWSRIYGADDLVNEKDVACGTVVLARFQLDSLSPFHLRCFFFFLYNVCTAAHEDSSPKNRDTVPRNHQCRSGNLGRQFTWHDDMSERVDLPSTMGPPCARGYGLLGNNNEFGESDVGPICVGSQPDLLQEFGTAGQLVAT